MEVFNRVLCKENIKLEPKYISKGFKAELTQRLKKKVEGICSKHGYIKHDSVEVYKVAPGVVELISLAGNVTYDVYFYADVCNPMLGSIINAVVSNINRFGILAEAGYFVGDEYMTVLEIIIAKNSVNIQSDVNLDDVKVGDELRIEIIGKKFELGEKKISAIGRAVKEMIKKKEIQAKELADDEEEEDVEEAEGEAEEYEEDEEEVEKSLVDEEEEEEEEDYEELDETDVVKQGGSDFFSDEDGSLFSEGGEFDADEFDGEDKEYSEPDDD